MIACPICNHVNPVGTARCEKCDTWLAQANDVGLKPQVRSEASRSSGAGAPLTPQFAEELLALGRDGQMIEAIKRFREATGLGLRESKEAVEALVAGRGLPSIAGADVSSDDAPVVEFLRAGNVIGAIKQHRTATGLGLKESKDAVEAIARKYGITPQQKGCFGVILLTIALPLCGLVFSGIW